MAEKKNSRAAKKQLGQFMTPDVLVDYVIRKTQPNITLTSRILEPSLGEGAFVFAAIDLLLNLRQAEGENRETALRHILENNVYGVEYDEPIFAQFKNNFHNRYRLSLDEVNHNFVRADFFRYEAPVAFDVILGNPPFGGTFDPEIEDALDRKYGNRGGYKIKKETYSFFTVACLDMLADNGHLVFILSDTFLTINTMQGLRRLLAAAGKVNLFSLTHFSEETDYGMVILSCNTSETADHLTVDKKRLPLDAIEQTPNYSWKLSVDTIKYFEGDKVGDYLLASSGMTIGKNELFLRSINSDNTIVEPYEFSYVQAPITLSEELKRARLGKISPAKQKALREQEKAGETYKKLQWAEKNEPETISLPHADYSYYNKACNASFYAAPSTVVYWANDGEAVYTFKKNGAWYLHGVGGKSFFKKEAITWNLISTTLKVRYLPSGYILDSGAPVAILREKVAADELWFILGWLNTPLATRILKDVINHTKNIQGKDVERMPYPFWVSKADKSAAVKKVKALVVGLQAGTISEEDVEKTRQELEKLYKYPED